MIVHIIAITSPHSFSSLLDAVFLPVPYSLNRDEKNARCLTSPFKINVLNYFAWKSTNCYCWALDVWSVRIFIYVVDWNGITLSLAWMQGIVTFSMVLNLVSHYAIIVTWLSYISNLIYRYWVFLVTSLSACPLQDIQDWLGGQQQKNRAVSKGAWAPEKVSSHLKVFHIWKI